MNHSMEIKNQTPVWASETQLIQTLEPMLRHPVADAEVSALPGDASTRRYFRISYSEKKDAEKNGSLIVMQLERPAPGENIDFILMLKFLQGLDLPVPHLLKYDSAQGLLFLEDCSDTTLEIKLGECDEAEQREYYRKAVDLLVQMQTRGTRNINPDCPAFHLRFDVEKLMQELNFMLEHYVTGLRKSPLIDEDARVIRRQFETLCKKLEAQKPCFTHRDYHSRNLMVHNGGLTMIDFQDARMGPCQYDLVSLLRDSYFPLKDEWVEELKEYFLEKKEEAEGKKIDRQEFDEVFDL
ncbi:MAG: aminoglycoside phosphotransferase family protein, partial [Nitrospinales bacterium]